jgi:hypothetical protein
MGLYKCLDLLCTHYHLSLSSKEFEWHSGPSQTLAVPCVLDTALLRGVHSTDQNGRWLYTTYVSEGLLLKKGNRKEKRKNNQTPTPALITALKHCHGGSGVRAALAPA